MLCVRHRYLLLFSLLYSGQQKMRLALPFLGFWKISFISRICFFDILLYRPIGTKL